MSRCLSRLVAACVLFATSYAFADWQPTFVDNFNGSTLNTQAWVPGWSMLPRRLNYYDARAAQVRNGVLRLQMLDLPQSDRPYSTAALTTQGLFQQRYGYFEIRARIPSGAGFWPAFWLMPQTGVWSSEIDIAEFRGHRPDTVHYAFHYGNRLRNENGLTATLPVDASENFHNYAVRWSQDRIEYLFDGEVMHVLEGEELLANAREEMFLILNMALSSQHTSWIPVVDESTHLDGVFEVDYVRVYREVADGQFDTIPGPDEIVPDVQTPISASTALAVSSIGKIPPIIRNQAPISGEIEVTAHTANLSATVSVVLTELSDFNPVDGRYRKSGSLDTRNFRVELNASGDSQRIRFEFDPAPASPTAYSVDVLIRDPQTGNKKSLATYAVVQYVDSDVPGSGAFLQGFFRDGVAAYVDGRVSGTLQLQLQQAMLIPHLEVTYQLEDIESGEVLELIELRHEHTDIGLQTLEPEIPALLDTERAVALRAIVTDADRTIVVDDFAWHVEGTAVPPAGWDGGQTSNPVAPPTPLGGEIPVRNWRATFVDNFNGLALNPLGWIANRDQVARRISQYHRDGVAVENGLLHLRPLLRPESDKPYTSGAITTQGLFSQQYGYFEVRARVPLGNGFWPAFWLMPESGRWTSEIDVAEFRGHIPNGVHHAYHYGQRLRNENGRSVTLPVDATEAFHNYAVYWTPERLDFLFDGRIVHSVTDAAVVANASSSMYLILNLALASPQTVGWLPTVDASTDFSRSFEVDYVRVFAADESGPLVGIPAPDSVLEDLFPGAYDDTALSVHRIPLEGESDLQRYSGPVFGRLEVTSHKPDFDGLVTVMLVPITEFNESDGRYAKGEPIGVRNYQVRLDNVGDSVALDYYFEPGTEEATAYAVDVLVRDPESGNRRSFRGHRFVQIMPSEQDDAGVHFNGYFREGVVNYEAGELTAVVELQLQQAMLVSAGVLSWEVVRQSDGVVVSSWSERLAHEYVGLLRLETSTALELDEALGHSVRVGAQDASGSRYIPYAQFEVGGTGEYPIGEYPPVRAELGTELPREAAPERNFVRDVLLTQTGETISLDLQLLLESGQQDDVLLYNVKLFGPAGELIQKMTGETLRAASGDILRIERSGIEPLPVGDYRLVVFIYANSWDEENRVVTQTLTIPLEN